MNANMAWSATNFRQPLAARGPLAGPLICSGPAKGHLAEYQNQIWTFYIITFIKEIMTFSKLRVSNKVRHFKSYFA